MHVTRIEFRDVGADDNFSIVHVGCYGITLFDEVADLDNSRQQSSRKRRPYPHVLQIEARPGQFRLRRLELSDSLL